MKMSLHGFGVHKRKVFLTKETMSTYFLLGLVIMLDLDKLVLSICTGSGSLELRA